MTLIQPFDYPGRVYDDRDFAYEFYVGGGVFLQPAIDRYTDRQELFYKGTRGLDRQGRED